MATIDNLWDEPVESEPAPHLVGNLVTSSEDPLFLQSDSDNEDRMGTAVSQQSKAPDDIGALFDVDDDEENGRLSSVTYEQLRKDALSGGKVLDDGPSSGENQRATEDPPDEATSVKSKSNKKDEDEGAASTKRTIPKLNEELLLSEKGIRALIKEAKQWRPRGKGHEIPDLNRLLRTYQYWAHQMYPRHTFDDTIERVEKLTHSRRMHVALSQWHDEARGISRHESIDIGGIDSDEEEHQVEPPRSRQTPEPPTRPPSSASERTSDPEDGFDMNPGQKYTEAPGGDDEFDFEVEMWDDAPFAEGPPFSSTNPANPVALAKPSAPPLSQGEDQDMWDLADELQAQAKSPGDANPPDRLPEPVDDDDWDSMYA